MAERSQIQSLVNARRLRSPSRKVASGSSVPWASRCSAIATMAPWAMLANDPPTDTRRTPLPLAG